MLLRDLFPEARVSGRARRCVGVVLLLLGGALLLLVPLIVIDAWQQFQGAAGILDGVAPRFRRRALTIGVAALLVGGALVHAGWKEVRAGSA